MAQRKRPEINPVLDSKSDLDSVHKAYAMEPHQLAKIVRLIKSGSGSRVQQLQSAASDAMARLRLTRDASRAIAGIPDASDNVNIQDFVKWSQALPRRGARRALGQLISIDATIAARIGG